ncbi:MAG: hypothetical protein H6961_05350 [Chromatiaceae bacterium]|nr:hypothetical protein [Chromatiaceae bacterium]MCP5440497.1 hypothetical protein [Chromatiaceae bacterium]HPE79789.1 LPS assembly lipoprotein LptE [Gammaproteobacteria bacterium]
MRRMPCICNAAFATGLLLLLATLGLTACGFQPRGQAVMLSGVPSPLHIAGLTPYSPLQRELANQLEASGASLSETAAGAAAVLRISDWRSGSRVLSVNSRNKAVEYELEESATFALRTADGREPVAPQTVRTLRILFQPEDAVLGSSREAELLRADMRRQLVDSIVRRLAATR